MNEFGMLSKIMAFSLLRVMLMLTISDYVFTLFSDILLCHFFTNEWLCGISWIHGVSRDGLCGPEFGRDKNDH